MKIAAGSKLGPYEIVSPLGAGAMGEVFKARDTRLDRSVAIKILSSSIIATDDMKLRFEREARSISQLQHPNICTLHDVGRDESSQTDFLVMEYLEGETLADRINRGQLPAEQAIRYAIQIAEALDCAHRRGIVHRDLKPGNIMLTKAGAKILDFGLAKARPISPASDAMTALITQAKPLTAEGTIVGTFQYMAPEVLEGHEADARSDIFSFGAVLYEMLTARPAFTGKTRASIIAAVLASDPIAIASIQPLSPPAIDRLINTCLEKNPDERLQSAHDLVLQLRWIAEAGSQTGSPAVVITKRKYQERLSLIVACVAAIAALGLAAHYWQSDKAEPPLIRSFLTDSTVRLLASGDNAGPVVISPDGKNVVYLGVGQSNQPILYVRSLTALTASVIAGTQDAKFPFWSPDSKSIAYFQSGKLRIAPINGNPPITVANAPDGRGGSWNAAGLILFSPEPRAGVFQVNANGGGTPEQVVKPHPPDNTTKRWPQWLPDGKHFLYFAGDHNSATSEKLGIYYASLDGKEDRLVTRTLTGGQYVSGHLLYLRENALLAQSFDPKQGKVSGEPQVIAQNVSFDITTWRASFSASDDGRLVAYHLGGAALGTHLDWFDLNGKKLGSVAGPEFINDARLSPDGRRVVMSLGDTAPDLWIVDLERKTRNRLTFQGGPNLVGIWSPDGKQIAFGSGRGGHLNIYVKPADGSTEEQPMLPQGDRDRTLSDWTRDGRYLVYYEGSSAGDYDIFAVPVAGERKPITVIHTKGFDTDPAVSPDGKWIAYSTDTSGKTDVYVSRFPEGGGTWQISNAGGSVPRWSHNGDALYYISADRLVMKVPLKTANGSFESGTPITLFRSNAAAGPAYSYDVTPDGKRFLIDGLGEGAEDPVVLISNWQTELKK